MGILSFGTETGQCHWLEPARFTTMRGRPESGARTAISRQVLREYLAAVTRPAGAGEALWMDDALAHVARLEARLLSMNRADSQHFEPKIDIVEP